MKKEGNAIILKPNDIIRLNIGDRIRVWRITSVCLGSVKEESLVGIETLDMSPGAVGDGIKGAKIVKEMFVPYPIIELVICNERKILCMPLDVQKRLI